MSDDYTPGYMEAPARLRVLLIHGDRAWLQLTTAVLATQYEVVSAPNLDEAVSCARRWLPSLILVDAGFSGLNALGLHQRLRAEPGLVWVPILVCTEDASLADQMGHFPSFKGWLPKDASQRALQEAVSKALSPVAPPATGQAPGGSPSQAPRYRVVVTDDEPTFLQFLDLAVHRADIRFHKASGGAEALELVRQVKPDLIVTDMMMPDLTGIELMRELGKDERYKGIPCILITSTKLKPKQVEMLLIDFPAIRYVLPKPCSIEALRAAFSSLLKPAGK